MTDKSALSRLGLVYVWTTVAAGTAALLYSILNLYVHPVGNQWLTLAALTLLSGSFTVKVPKVHSSISVSETFVIICVLLFGPAAATVTVALEGLIISLWILRRSTEVYRVFFNMASAALSVWIASQVFYALIGHSPSTAVTPRLAASLLPLGVFTLTYFLLNSWIVAFAVSFETSSPVLPIWRDSFAWLSLNYFGGASVAILLVQFTRDVNLGAIGLIAPFLLISYLTFKTSMGRVEDANQHLVQLNALHLSTIETLAMAIDAKDQITHGHIRRVQQYAVGLARALGVVDPNHIRAIEAAALLHDMGKLAIPEYILNKPGKLTAAEFEKMKLHATIGADILSAIHFPYPVVPIVRHHHEFWNGAGYPAGLSGTDIPIGARILSVVDCFDALTSDRPYRLRLTDADSLKILLERRGTMYDPLVVDTFVTVHEQIATAVAGDASTPRAPSHAARSARQSPDQDAEVGANITPDRDEHGNGILAFYDLAQRLAGRINLIEACELISTYLKRLTPFSMCVFFIYEPDVDAIIARFVADGVGESILGLALPLGERISGWVAANRQSVITSEPALDFRELGLSFAEPMASALSAPLVTTDGRLIGVLTLYTSGLGSYTVEHKQIIDTVACQLAHAVSEAVAFDKFRTRLLHDADTGLPNVEHLKMVIGSEQNRLSYPSALVYVRIHGLNASRDRLCFTGVLIPAIRQTLRGADVLFHCGSDEFVILLSRTDLQAARTIAARVRGAGIESMRCSSADGLSVSVRTGIACAPHDGESLLDLLYVARMQVNCADLTVVEEDRRTSSAL